MSATEKCDPKKHLPLLAAVCVRLVVKANVKITAKRIDYYVGITNRERLFGSN